MSFAGYLRVVAGVVLYGGVATIALGQAAGAKQEAAPGANTPGGVPSAQAQVGLRPLKQTLDTLTIEKWKASKAVKQATTTNMASIRHDLEDTLPSLLSAADATPNSVAETLPLSRNLSALYDVVLRVTVVAETSAPHEQTTALEGVLTSLESARRTLSENLQTAAEAQDRQVAELQKTLSAKPAPVVQSAAVPCTPIKPATPAKKNKKPAARKTASSTQQ